MRAKVKKIFFWGGGGVVSRTGDFLPSRGRRLNILRKIKKRRLKLHFKCSAKIFLACHLKRITQAVISDKKFKFRFGTNAFWDTSCNDLIHIASCIEPNIRSQLPLGLFARTCTPRPFWITKQFCLMPEKTRFLGGAVAYPSSRFLSCLRAKTCSTRLTPWRSFW